MSKHLDAIVAYVTTEVAPDVSPDEIAPDYDLMEGGIVDSLAMVRLIAWLGRTFAIPVNDIDIAPADLSTLTRIDRFIAAHSRLASAEA